MATKMAKMTDKTKTKKTSSFRRCNHLWCMVCVYSIVNVWIKKTLSFASNLLHVQTTQKTSIYIKMQDWHICKVVLYEFHLYVHIDINLFLQC